MTWTKDDYLITTDKAAIDIDYTHGFLSQTYWAEGIPKEVVQRSIDGSLCFAVFQQQQQIGFARVISDGATFAYLADVFIDPVYRGKGLSKWLMEIILSYPTLQGLRRFLLATRDAHGLYQQLASPLYLLLTHGCKCISREYIREWLMADFRISDLYFTQGAQKRRDK